MPEGPEVRIMSDFINHVSKDIVYSNLYYVNKGNQIEDPKLISDFSIQAKSSGKGLSIEMRSSEKNLKFPFFMGMTGNWKFVPTNSWDNTKFVRFRMDSSDGNSLILHGGYMGPKFILGKFNSKRGPDPVDNYTLFKKNILENLDRKAFNFPICDVLLNQEYFNGIGNYLRSTILYYMDQNPFNIARDYINDNPNIFEMIRDVFITSYSLNGGRVS